MNRRPNLLLAGVPRAGTTALARMLASHPDVFVSVPKEPHSLAYGHLPPNAFSGVGDDKTINRQITPIDEYLTLFDGRRERFLVDASVSTMYSWQSARRALQDNVASDFKVIVCLREPADRAHSSYLYLRARGVEQETFASGLRLERQRAQDGWHHMWHYEAAGRYAEQLGGLLVDGLGDDRLCVVFFEDLRADPGKVLQEIALFLGIEGDFTVAHGDVNRGGEPRGRAAATVLSAVTASPHLRSIARQIPFGLRHWLKARLLRRPDPDENEIRRLREVFTDDVAFVEQLIGRVPDAWKQT